MSTIDRYLRHVRFWAPRARSADLVEELRGALQQCLDEHKERLGRPLNAADEQEALRAFGPPQLVVARLAGGRPVISAGLSFYFWRVLTIVIGVTFLIQATLVGMRAAASTSPAAVLIGGAEQTLIALLTGFALVSLTFMVLERVFGPR